MVRPTPKPKEEKPRSVSPPRSASPYTMPPGYEMPPKSQAPKPSSQCIFLTFRKQKKI